MQSNPSMFIINTRGRCTFDTHNRRTVMLIMYLHMAAQTLVISFVEIGRVQIWIINLLYVAKYSFSSWISQCFLFTRLLIHFLLESLSIFCSQVCWHFGSIFMWVLAYHCFQYTFCVSICQSFFFTLCWLQLASSHFFCLCLIHVRRRQLYLKVLSFKLIWPSL